MCYVTYTCTTNFRVAKRRSDVCFLASAAGNTTTSGCNLQCSIVAHSGLPFAQYGVGGVQEALVHNGQAQAMDPRYPEIYVN